MCKKTAPKLNGMFCGTAQFSHQVCQFFSVSSVCLLVCVTMVDKNKAVVCCMLAASAIMLSEKKKRKLKIWSKKWYLKRNISCDVHLPNELLEQTETVGFPQWPAQFSTWKRTGEDSSGACAIACQNCAAYSVFPSVMRSHSQIAQFNWHCILTLDFAATGIGADYVTQPNFFCNERLVTPSVNVR